MCDNSNISITYSSRKQLKGIRGIYGICYDVLAGKSCSRRWRPRLREQQRKNKALQHSAKLHTGISSRLLIYLFFIYLFIYFPSSVMPVIVLIKFQQRQTEPLNILLKIC